MRTAEFHTDNASKAQILNEYEKIKNKTSTLPRGFRDKVEARAKRILKINI